MSKPLNLVQQHAERLRSVRTLELLQSEARRVERLTVKLDVLAVDFSKQAFDDTALDALCDLARERELEKQIIDLFDGEPINRSEKRAAMHAVLRAVPVDLAHDRTRDAHAQASAAQMRVAQVVDALRRGENAVTDVIHVGIGGSDLGPRLLYQALRATRRAQVRVHFLANLDGHALERLLQTLDPARTAVILVSKSFTTQETLLNGKLLQTWLLNGAPSLAASRLIAVTAKPEVARAFGVSEPLILPIWEWLGGRYSVWSAVSLCIALAFGMEVMAELQRGAREMDRHFVSAPWKRNIPVLLAFASLFNRLRSDTRAHAIVPYDNRLALLPSYLQQLMMESNGKSVRPDASEAAFAAVQTIFGGVGTEVQHAFFQALHQGPDVVPVDFIGIIDAGHRHRAHQRGLLANMLAQSAALLRGRSFQQALADTDAAMDEIERHVIARQRECPGDRPSTVILMPEINARSLGSLLAMYEHQTFVQAVLADINPFDQFGVELGKQIAQTLEPSLISGEPPMDCDASTAGLIRAIWAKWGG